MGSERKFRSIVNNCDTFATDSFFSPEIFFANKTFPGAWANRKFDVMTAQITVDIRLSLNSFD